MAMAMSAARPDASRVYANELLHGAPVLGEWMRGGKLTRRDHERATAHVVSLILRGGGLG